MNRRNLLKRTAQGGLALAVAQRVWAQGSDSLSLDLVHPDLRPMAKAMIAQQQDFPSIDAGTLAQWRQRPSFGGPPRATPAWVKRQIPGAKGHREVTVYVINASPEHKRPALLHTHGGGFVIGSAQSSIHDLQEICEALDCMAVTVEYRLAPETTYQGSIEDNYAALTWLHAHAAELGADPARIAVIGESAGGGHAALLAITARNRGEVPVAFQCLTYPMLDDRTGSSRATRPHIGQLIWTPASNRFGWGAFLGMAPGGPRVPARAVPARTVDLKGLPPAFIGVGSIDLFVDEDMDYARRLNAADVPTELIVVPGAFHGFDAIGAGTGIVQWFKTARLNALRTGLKI